MKKDDIEKYNGKKVYMVFNENGDRTAVGNGKNIYLSKGHIKGSLNQQKRYCDIEEKYKGFKIVTYKLIEIEEKIDLLSIIEKD